MEIEENPGTASSGPPVVLGATVTLKCSHAALGTQSQPWNAGCWHLWGYMPRWVGFCKTGNVVLLKAEETKAYQYHLGAERPLYCLISHTELEFQFKGVFMNKINCILMRDTIQDHLEPEQFHLGYKSPTQVPWSSSVHSLLSELPAVWEEGKDSISEEPFSCYLLHVPCCRTSACSFAFTFYTSEEEQWWLWQEQPLQNQLPCRETGSTSHLPDLCKIQFF